ncbi:hypothetical protein TL16_g01554 [Triparma laevis f. inornata]|uniref:DRBM domain-containing protein n=1 Tax=Triparma laevis f. inornata TaxID=1714386 RepID=A0A9W6ZPB5_9STRA|nr:hypothetical protein TL16_g01554 [Triparma laevis f. inornata]
MNFRRVSSPSRPVSMDFEEARLRHSITAVWTYSQSGPDHLPSFAADLTLREALGGGHGPYRGEASSKRRAKEAACRAAIDDIESWGPGDVRPGKRELNPSLKTPVMRAMEYFDVSSQILSFEESQEGVQLFSCKARVDGKVRAEGEWDSKQGAKHAACLALLETLGAPDGRVKEREETLAWVGDRALYMIVAMMGEERGWTGKRMQDVSAKIFCNEFLARHGDSGGGVHQRGTEVEKRVGEEVLGGEKLRGAK